MLYLIIFLNHEKNVYYYILMFIIIIYYTYIWKYFFHNK